jgi:hypothetical protein
VPLSGQRATAAGLGYGPDPGADESYAAAQAAGLAALLALGRDASQVPWPPGGGRRTEPRPGLGPPAPQAFAADSGDAGAGRRAGRHHARRTGEWPGQLLRARDLRGAGRAGSPGLTAGPRRIAVTSAMSRGQRACYVVLAGAWLVLSW